MPVPAPSPISTLAIFKLKADGRFSLNRVVVPLDTTSIDAGKYLPHIPKNQFPGQALTVELYREWGIRAVEIGSLMFGGYDPVTGEEIAAPKELVRLAVPRRVFTGSHLDYVADVIQRITARKGEIRGLKIARQATYLRHFTIELEELTDRTMKVK